MEHFGRPSLAHHYFMYTSLSDLCSVADTILNKNMHFHHMTNIAMPWPAQEPLPQGK